MVSVPSSVSVPVRPEHQRLGHGRHEDQELACRPPGWSARTTWRRRRCQHASTNFLVWMSAAPRLRISWRATKSSSNLAVTCRARARAHLNAWLPIGSWTRATMIATSSDEHRDQRERSRRDRDDHEHADHEDRRGAQQQEAGLLEELEDPVEVVDAPGRHLARQLAVVVVDAERAEPEERRRRRRYATRLWVNLLARIRNSTTTSAPTKPTRITANASRSASAVSFALVVHDVGDLAEDQVRRRAARASRGSTATIADEHRST